MTAGHQQYCLLASKLLSEVEEIVEVEQSTAEPHREEAEEGTEECWWLGGVYALREETVHDGGWRHVPSSRSRCASAKSRFSLSLLKPRIDSRIWKRTPRTRRFGLGDRCSCWN